MAWRDWIPGYDRAFFLLASAVPRLAQLCSRCQLSKVAWKSSGSTSCTVAKSTASCASLAASLPWPSRIAATSRVTFPRCVRWRAVVCMGAIPSRLSTSPYPHTPDLAVLPPCAGACRQEHHVRPAPLPQGASGWSLCQNPRREELGNGARCVRPCVSVSVSMSMPVSMPVCVCGCVPARSRLRWCAPDWGGVVLRLPVGDGYERDTSVHIFVDAKGRLGT